jgi:hypothetical protein
VSARIHKCQAIVAHRKPGGLTDKRHCGRWARNIVAGGFYCDDCASGARQKLHLDLLEQGARLTVTYGEHGASYTMEPGGRSVSPQAARKLIHEGLIEPAGKDTLLPGASPQQWVLRTRPAS